MRESAEAQDEEYGRSDVGDGCEACRHYLSLPYFRNISSMRRVTANPPNMLIATSAMLTTASPMIQASGRSPPPPASGGATCTSAPMAMMLEIALVTLMSGVCSAGVTFQITM